MKDRLLLTAVWLKDFKKLGDKAHISAYAAKTAFFILLSAVPMITLAIGITTVVFPLEILLTKNGGGSLFSDDIKNILWSVLSHISETKGASVISVSSVLLIWSATKGIRSMAQGISVIYGGEKPDIISATIRSVVYTGFMLIALGLSFVMLVMAAPLETFIEYLLGPQNILIAVINMRNVIFFLLLCLLFSFAYSFLAESDFDFRSQLPGGALASAGWIVYSFGYSVYINYFSDYSVFYGGFGTVMLFMVWLYMCMNILLWGALFNRIRNGIKKHNGD